MHHITHMHICTHARTRINTHADTTNTHHHQQQQQQQQHLPATTMQSTLLQPHTLSLESLNSSSATLANLKKQRSLSRTNNGILISENGSVLGAANNTNNTINNHLHTGSVNNNNSILANDTNSGAVNQQPQSGGQHPSLLDFNNAASGGGSITSGGEQSTGYSNASSMNKFSGITGDVVSDSTSSKKCCTLM